MSSVRKIHFDEVVMHSERNDCWLLIHNKVYDVTEFMEEHPGGDEVILAAVGKDATDDFEDIGHSDDAKKLMDKYHIGDVDVKSIPANGRKSRPTVVLEPIKQKHNSMAVKLLQFLLPLLILGAAFVLRSAFKKD